jgi:hypothetical protein
LGNIGISAFATRIHRGGRVAVSRAVDHHTVGIRCDGTWRGTDVRKGTTATPPVDGAINFVAGDSRGGTSRPGQADTIDGGRRASAREGCGAWRVGRRARKRGRCRSGATRPRSESHGERYRLARRNGRRKREAADRKLGSVGTTQTDRKYRYACPGGSERPGLSATGPDFHIPDINGTNS